MASMILMKSTYRASRAVLSRKSVVLQPGEPASWRLRPLSTFSFDDFKSKPEVAKETAPKTPEVVAQEHNVREGNRSQMHFKLTPHKHPLGVTKAKEGFCFLESVDHHSVWTKDEVNSVQITHLEPPTTSDAIAYKTVATMRFFFDLFAGFKFFTPTAEMYLRRIIFLETVAGIPGMVGGMARHLKSLRTMERDYGWIHTLLEEAENERMHLLTFLKLKKPGPLFRASVIITQGIFFNVFFVAYLINPQFCHRLVGYIEEEAVVTYSHILEEIDNGKLPEFNKYVVPAIAKGYWKLAPDATFRDLILAVRADEANHRVVNHTFADIDEDAHNPFLVKENYENAAKVVEVKSIRKVN